MKIFLSFLQGKPGHPIPAYGFWEYYIKQGISEAGHTWSECKDVDWAYGLVNQSKDSFAAWKTAAWERTIRSLKQNPVELFLSYLYPSQVDASAIRRIRDMGIPCVNFFCDNVREFKKIPDEFSVFDLNWVPEYKALAMYKRAALPCMHLPMPMWVAPEHRVVKDEKLDQATFIGSRDIQRLLLFRGILEKSSLSIPLAIYGAEWLPDLQGSVEDPVSRTGYSLMDKIAFQFSFLKEEGLPAYFRKIQQRKLHPVISGKASESLKGKPDFEEYIRLTQESMLTIGVNRYPSFRFPIDKPDTYSRLRDIEAPMLGACYITEWTEGLDKMYEIGKEIEVYNSPDDFFKKTEQIILDKAKRKTMRDSGQKRALKEHSIINSINRITDNLL